LRVIIVPWQGGTHSEPQSAFHSGHQVVTPVLSANLTLGLIQSCP
jgi:hypothetical protein